MVTFFQSSESVMAVGLSKPLAGRDVEKLEWLFSGAKRVDAASLSSAQLYVGPRREMVTPWSTNAVEIAQNMGVGGVERIELFTPVDESSATLDPMLQAAYRGLGQDIFTVERKPEPILHIDNIAQYNRQEGLALSDDELSYLEGLSRKLGRCLTDSEIFGFSQVNSEHCRHKIFNGTFVIDGCEMPATLFSLIKKTTAENRNRVLSAYTDNCA
ncbi:MAG: phosphoribosylformylglycinamidine synthase, partial [Prevotellaceae bacterium]|nr:phosphoribosylformylglycinamidine synthase [Prevotellaceae bacterium]